MLTLKAPAKLNLYLRVLGRRPDGYHEIETIFERIDLADELTFEAADRLRLTCADPSLSCGEDNLVLRAARALQTATGANQGAEIHLTKRIPIAAGLGGGSSDAAATLKGLNALWKLGLSSSQLAELGAALGSDVPFFFCESPFAVGSGRGEKYEPLETSISLAHVLVVPPERLSTKEVYTGAQFDLTAPKPSSTMVHHALRNGPAMAGLAEGLWNDLEPEAIRRCPVISTIQSLLRTVGCVGIRMSGSGSSVFGLCRDLPHAREAAAEVRTRAKASWRIEVVGTDAESV